MHQKPHDMNQRTATNIVYDTLMGNDSSIYDKFDLDSITLQEVDSEDGYIYFDIDTEKGIKRVHVEVCVEDMDEEDELTTIN